MSEEKNSFLISTVQSYGRNLLGFIRRRVKNDADAEDILQDVWYQFSSVINTGPIENTGAWLYRVARNRILDKHKKKSESLFDDIFGPGDEEDDGSDFKDLIIAEGDDPETQFMKNLFWERLVSALDELPQEQKDVFTWHELDSLSFQQISEITGQNVNTLISRKRYAVLHLRERLQQLYKEIIKH